MRTELEKLWLTVEATARVRDKIRDAILKRFEYTSVFESLELTASELYIMEQANRQLEAAKTAHREAELRELKARQARCEVCGEYLPGHATCGSDICTGH